jgi:glycosyl transferase family 25
MRLSKWAREMSVTAGKCCRFRVEPAPSREAPKGGEKMTQNEFKYKFLVINLEKSIGRWQNISLKLDELKVSYERIEGIYGGSIDWLSVSDDLYCREYMGRSIQPGEVGCFMSHVKALRHFVEGPDDYVIILEDDAIISSEIIEVINKSLKFLQAVDFYVVNLGPSDYKYTSMIASLGNNKLYCSHRFPMLATGLLWSRSGALAFLNSFRNVSLPYDNYLRKLFSGTNKSFSFRPPLVWAGDFCSDIDSEGLTRRRSQMNRSKYYFFVKQGRIIKEKLKSIRAMISYRLYK